MQIIVSGVVGIGVGGGEGHLGSFEPMNNKLRIQNIIFHRIWMLIIIIE